MAYELDIIAAAKRHGIDPAIALGVALREGGGQIRQFNRDGSVIVGRAGEIGMFQVKPSTAGPGVNLADPQQNIEAGVGYLAGLLDQFGRWDLAIAAYNWGPGRVEQMMSGKATMPSSVRSYIADVLGSRSKLPMIVGSAPGTQFAGRKVPSLLGLGLIFVAGIVVLR